MHSGKRRDLRWWQKAIVYQIYPRSFQDSNGDGIGDLPGITWRLDYLRSLCVDAIWLSPFYPSPMKDFGYDITDYTSVDPAFGTMEDFDYLLEESHRRGLKLIVDLVPNHTSDQHPWFLESRSRRDNPKRNWYVWHDPARSGGPPNNWLSVFGGPAWTLDERTGQYYLHHFLKEQPDLNFRNQDVLEAAFEVMRFWLDRGVDGFRVDVISRLVEDAEFRDEPPNPDWDGVDPYYSLRHIHTIDLMETHEIVRKMRRLTDSYPDRILIGEVYLDNPRLLSYYGPNLDECHLPFNFQLISLPWAAQVVRRAVDTYEGMLPEGAWPNWVLGNHDRNRVATRVGRDMARLANMLILTLRGTPTIYYGEEIGMENVEIPPEYVQDPTARLQPEIAHVIGRDPVRTPMQWDRGPNSGFAPPGSMPWLPLASDYPVTNVASEDKDPSSILALNRKLACLRREEPSLHGGDYTSLDLGADEVYAYLRSLPGADRFLIVLNFDSDPHVLGLGHLSAGASVEVDTDMQRTGPVEWPDLRVAPREGLVLRLFNRSNGRHRKLP